MSTPKPLPPIELLRSLLDYNPETGDITWRVCRRPRTKAGDLAGCTVQGYRRIGIKNEKTVNCLAHRIAWALHYGEDPHPHELDHIDRNPLNNRIENLRKVTPSENNMNRDAYSNSGEKYIHKRGKGHHIVVKRKYVGWCKTLEEAVRLRDEYTRTCAT